MKLNFGLFVLVIFSLFGCKSKKETKVVEQVNVPVVMEEKTGIDLYAGSYLITELASFPEFNEVSPTINIKEDGKVSGNNGCNSYFGKLDLDGELIFSNIGSTRMACSGEAGDVEKAVNAAFQEGTVLDMDDKGFVLLSDNTILLKAKRLSLEIGEWQLVSLSGKSIQEPIVFFNIIKGNVAGTTGCNSFTGILQEEGFKITFKDISATEMDCKGFDTVQEVVFLRALEKVTRYRLEGSIARFYFGDKELFVLENIGEF